MKKVYFAPAVEEVELEIENVILAGSDPNVPGTNNDENNSDDIIDI
jgi:hypothetical protein